MPSPLVIPGTFRLNKLNDELFAAIPAWRAGGMALAFVTYENGVLQIARPDTLWDATAQSVCAAHDPTTPSAGEQQAQEDSTALTDFRANLLAGAQLLGWVGTLQAGNFGANTGQWAALTPAQQTAFMRRVLMAVAIFARRN